MADECIAVKIPTKRYFRKYLESKYKHHNKLVCSGVIGNLVFGLLRNRLNDARFDASMQQYSDWYCINIPRHMAFDHLNLNVNGWVALKFNKAIEELFEWELYHFVNTKHTVRAEMLEKLRAIKGKYNIGPTDMKRIMKTSERQDDLRLFMSMYNITTDDISFEAIKKKEYRYRMMISSGHLHYLAKPGENIPHDGPLIIPVRDVEKGLSGQMQMFSNL